MTKTATTTAGVLLAMGIAGSLAGCGTMKMSSNSVVRDAPVCQDIVVPIYFEADAATVTPDGRRLLVAEARRAKACTVDSVKVVGLADAAGEAQANLDLSKRRAAAVAEAIQKAGLPAAEIDLVAAGQAGAVNKAGEVRPVRRRADVTIKLSAPK